MTYVFAVSEHDSVIGWCGECDVVAVWSTRGSIGVEVVIAANNNVVVASSVSNISVEGCEGTALCGESAETGGVPCTFDTTVCVGVWSAEAGIINCIYVCDHCVVTGFVIVSATKAYFLNHCTEGPIVVALGDVSVVSVCDVGALTSYDSGLGMSADTMCRGSLGEFMAVWVAVEGVDSAMPLGDKSSGGL